MNTIKRTLRRLPPIRALVDARDALAGERDALTVERDGLRRQCDALAAERDALRRWAGPEPRYAPPGHYYSPIPSFDYVKAQGERLFAPPPKELPGIELNEPGQLRLLSALEAFYKDLPFGAQPEQGLRYGFENPAYSYADGIFLYCMMRHLEPHRIVEIGCGNSSCLMLDVNELHFGGNIDCTFIDPDPARFLSLLPEDEREGIRLIPQMLQDVPLSRFTGLAAGDILFVDSSHVSKTGSDVNHLFFEILPRLKPGVHVHFHDVFYPFEYPKEWVHAGKAFNEAYLLRALLTYSSAFEIVIFNTYLEHFHAQRFAERMPLCLRNVGGSIWLRRR
jgi:hypothetical protein